MPIILASASAARRDVLSGAGLEFVVDPADVDEAAYKNHNPGLTNSALAPALAVEKARAVSPRHPGAIVLGADQTMECDGVCYDKPADMAAARRHLQHLRGRVHTLHSAICVVCDGEPLWSRVDDAHLAMRDFSDGFLDDYLATCGDAVLSSVGCYRLEAQGAHLFTRIDGDFFTILGLPLLPLLAFLRDGEFLH